MKDFFTQQKNVINKYLEQFISTYRDDRIVDNCQRYSVLQEIVEFTSRGKMIRGGLVAFSYGLYSSDDLGEALTSAGSALELLQTSLLIHDDIMDMDYQRRGKDTLFHSYSKKASLEKLNRAEHTGISMGICAGDISFFLAFQILNDLQISAEFKQRILDRVSREMTYVGMAQMNDVWTGAHPRDSKEEQILSLYRYKTGRYTFSLPLMLGALMADQDVSTLDLLAEIGEELGILFQIKDDELGIWGDETHIGKPVGSDIMEGKKTLFYHYLMDSASQEDHEELSRIFGNSRATTGDIQRVISAMDRYKIKEKVDQRGQSIKERLRTLMEKLPSSVRSSMEELYSFNLNRSK